MRGRVLGIDVGERRVGLAISDPSRDQVSLGLLHRLTARELEVLREGCTGHVRFLSIGARGEHASYMGSRILPVIHNIRNIHLRQASRTSRVAPV